MSQPVRKARSTTRGDATIDLDDQRRRRRGRAPDGPEDPAPCGAPLDPRWLALCGPGDGRPVVAALTSLPLGTWACGPADPVGIAGSSRLLGLPLPTDLRPAA